MFRFEGAVLAAAVVALPLLYLPAKAAFAAIDPDLEDMARALVTLGERDEADGQVWHLPAAEPLTGRQFLEVLIEEARTPARIAVASRPMIRIGGLFNPLLRELNETLYQFERPFVSDASKFQAAFGPFEPTPHQAAVGRTVDWFRRRYAA